MVALVSRVEGVGGKKAVLVLSAGGSQGCVGLRDCGYRLLLVRVWGWSGGGGGGGGGLAV